MPFLTPLFLQVALGYAPTEAGLFMAASVVGAMGSKVLVERLVGRLSPIPAHEHLAPRALHDELCADRPGGPSRSDCPVTRVVRRFQLAAIHGHEHAHARRFGGRNRK